MRARRSPNMLGHEVAIEFKSAIVKAKKILTGAGFPWSVTTGRYHPFASTQKTTMGAKVTRVGCSETIALHFSHQYPSEDRRPMEALALQALRDHGLPFDDRGFLDCNVYELRGA